MASNACGQLLRFTTWGESHGHSMGVVIDGCPANIPLSPTDIQQALDLRAPGRNPYTSPRQEADQAQIVSGLFQGKTTGAPIAIIIPNTDGDPSKYEPIKHLLRPGHANFTYLKKYQIMDHRGGGRASARETVCRVAAGAVAKKILQTHKINVFAYLYSAGGASLSQYAPYHDKLSENIYNSPLFCPDRGVEDQMIETLDQAKQSGDSVGGTVAFYIPSLPPGLGDPVYEKLEACLAKAMMSIPASKGFEIGQGFHAANMNGSTHNDHFDGPNQTTTNHAGGTLGGISTGMPLYGRVAFKPTSSIQKSQPTTDLQGNAATLTLPPGSRHDPCVAIRAVPVVSAMCQLVLADALLLQQAHLHAVQHAET